MKAVISIVALTILVAGCGSKTDANEKNFGAAIGQYLDKKGDLCLDILPWVWPQDIEESSLKNAVFRETIDHMTALEAIGFVKSEDTEVKRPKYVMTHDPEDIITIKIKRYTLTDASKPYQRQIESRLSGKPETAICWGKKALDKVVKWEGPIKLGDYQSANITYLYKIDGQADWATNPEILAAFPAVKATIEGAGKKEAQHGVSLTSQGWEPAGLNPKF